MDNLLSIETRYRDHYAKAADIDHDGWKKPARAPRAYRVAIAKTLIALAARLAPPVREPERETRPVQTVAA
jgi:hypothetical protein